MGTGAGNDDGGTMTVEDVEGTEGAGVAARDAADGDGAGLPVGGGGVRGGEVEVVRAPVPVNAAPLNDCSDRRAGFHGALTAVELHIGTHSQRSGRPLKCRAQ